MKSTYSAMALGLAALAITAGPLLAAPAAKISADQARKVVVTRFPHSTVVGKINYENEEKGWEYSVMIQDGKQLREVMVDAHSGKIVSVENTTASAEQRESGEK